MVLCHSNTHLSQIRGFFVFGSGPDQLVWRYTSARDLTSGALLPAATTTRYWFVSKRQARTTNAASPERLSLASW